MPSPVRRSLLLVLVTLFFTGCAAVDRGTGGEQRENNLLIGSEAAAEAGYRIQWAASLAIDRGQRVTSARVLGDVLITTEQPENLVSAISLRDGQVLWRRIVGSRTETIFPPARVDDTILINSDRRLYQLRVRDGGTIQIDPLKRVATTGPVVVDDLMVIGSVNGMVSAEDLESGIVRWEYQLTDQITTPLRLTANGNVIAADSRGEYAMVDGQTGDLFWRGRSFGRMTAQPALDQERVYLPSADRALYVVDRSTGRDEWIYRSTQPLTVSVGAYEHAILVPELRQGLVGLDPQTGEERWRVDQPGLRPVTARDDAAVVWSPNSVGVVEQRTGRVQAMASTRPLFEVVAGPENSLVLVSPQGQVLRLNRAR